MEGNHYRRQIECYVCGTTINTTAARSMCEECAAEAKRMHNRKNAKYHPKPDEFVVEYDPIPYEYGGFMHGASFTAEDIRCMLQATCDSFKVGTILHNSKGEKFKVVHGHRLAKILMPLLDSA